MDVLQKQLQVMDSTAITMCKDNDVDLVVFSMNPAGNIKKAVLQEKIGTLINKEQTV
jgi:uridylate kinase